jgi:outer membrane protein insertion porin family
MFFLGAEIEQPIIGDLIAVVGFIDTGTVDEDVSFSHYRVSVGTGIRVFLPFLAQAPLAFDFGFPLLKEDTDETRLFTFSIDIEY